MNPSPRIFFGLLATTSHSSHGSMAMNREAASSESSKEGTHMLWRQSVTMHPHCWCQLMAPTKTWSASSGKVEKKKKIQTNCYQLTFPHFDSFQGKHWCIHGFACFQRFGKDYGFLSSQCGFHVFQSMFSDTLERNHSVLLRKHWKP